MSSSILDMLSQQLGGDAVKQISRQLGAAERSTEKAISGALPMLVGALANNSRNADGANALAGALDRDHDGSILDDIGGFLGQGDAAAGAGAGILKHVLGGRQQTAANGLGKMSGLDGGSAGQLMAMLAPLVMGALGRQKRQANLDNTGLAGMLQGERERVQRKAPDAMGMLGSLIDADGDGDVKDDVARIGMSMLGKLFGGRR